MEFKQLCGTKVISGLLYITVFFTCNVANFDNFNDFAYFAYFDTILMNKIISGRTYVNGYINNIYNSGHCVLFMHVRKRHPRINIRKNRGCNTYTFLYVSE
jgi:hypothetical protein